jgi:hypothetical protein
MTFGPEYFGVRVFLGLGADALPVPRRRGGRFKEGAAVVEMGKAYPAPTCGRIGKSAREVRAGAARGRRGAARHSRG